MSQNVRASARIFAVVVAALSLSAPLGGGRTIAKESAGEQPTVTGSLVGKYLAARHAHSRRDYPAAADYWVDALKQAPDHVSLMRRTHTALLLDGRFDEAAELAADVVALDQRAALAKLTLAVAAIRDGRLMDAESALDDLSPTSVYRLLRPLLRAWTLFGADRFDEAIAALNPLSATTRAAAIYNVHAALLHAAHGNVAAAEKHFQNAALDDENVSLRTLDLYGQFLERQGRAQEALQIYTRYLADGSQSAIIRAAQDRIRNGEEPPPAIADAKAGAAEALFNLAGATARRPVPETALLLTRHAAVLRPDFPVLQALKGQLLEVLDRFEDANVAFAAVDPGSPLAPQLQLRTAGNLDRLGRFDDAAALLRTLAEDRPDDFQPLVELGDLMRRHERYEDAVTAYDAAFHRIAVVDRWHWTILYGRGIALERSKMWDRAEADFLKALEFEPEQPLVLNYLGYSWIDMGRNLERALDMVRRAVEQRPNDGYIVDSLGWAYYKLGRYEDAVRELERAVEIRPEDPVINDHLGDAYWQVGRQREAQFQWTAALGLDPEPDVRAAIEHKLANGLIREARVGGAVAADPSAGD